MKTASMQFWKISTEKSTRHAFQSIDYFRDAENRRVLNEEMNMIRLPVELYQSRLDVCADRTEVPLQRNKMCLLKNTASILCYEDQVHVEIGYTRTATSKIACLFHGPSIACLS